MPEQLGWFEQAPHGLAVLDRGAIASHVAAALVRTIGEALEQRGQAIFVPSAGRTHVDMFEILRRQHAQSIDWSRVVCVQMDEYAELGCTDDRSLCAQIERQLVVPLQMGHFMRFYDADGRFERTLQEYEQAIRALGGIDCAVHGVGVNGHIGFNEPDAPAAAHTRLAKLAPETQVANGITFSHGVTLGLETLIAARASIVVLQGAAKRLAAGGLLYGSVGPHNPVGYLRRCHRVSIYLDEAALPS